MNVLTVANDGSLVSLTRKQARLRIEQLQRLRLLARDADTREAVDAEIRDLQPVVDPERAYEACK